MAFSAKYSAEQRAALVAAVLDDGQTVPAAVRAAAAGELGETWTVTLGAAYSMVAKAKREQSEVPLSLEAEAAALARRLLRLAERDMDRIEKLDELAYAHVRCYHGLWKLMRAASTLPISAPPSAGVPEVAKLQGLAARLASEGDHGSEGGDVGDDLAHAVSQLERRVQSPALAAKVRASRAGRRPQHTT